METLVNEICLIAKRPINEISFRTVVLVGSYYQCTKLCNPRSVHVNQYALIFLKSKGKSINVRRFETKEVI